MRAVSVVALGPSGPIPGAKVTLDDHPFKHVGITNTDGYILFPKVPVSLGASHVWIVVEDFLDFNQHVDLPPTNINLPFTLIPKVAPLPAPPSRDELIGVNITFQGLVVDTTQFGKLPWFEAALPWLTPQDRQAVYAAKHQAGDTHCIVFLPSGPALYDEANQAYSADKFGPLDWTAGNTTIDPKFTDLIQEVIKEGFRILLYLGGDGDGDHYKVAFTQLDLLYNNLDYRFTLYKYCAVVPGWDGVFYGWPLEQVMIFGQRFRQLFPDGTLALHYSTGHIPVGEGGDDYKPRAAGQDIQVNPGRMADYDLLLGEYGGTDYNIHMDSTWQILNRLEKDYIRPPDQPAGDDPDRRYYLNVPNPRGPWGHCAMEYNLYAAVRCGTDFAGMVAKTQANRAYLKSMGVKHVG